MFFRKLIYVCMILWCYRGHEPLGSKCIHTTCVCIPTHPFRKYSRQVTDVVRFNHNGPPFGRRTVFKSRICWCGLLRIVGVIASRYGDVRICMTNWANAALDVGYGYDIIMYTVYGIRYTVEQIICFHGILGVSSKSTELRLHGILGISSKPAELRFVHLEMAATVQRILGIHGCSDNLACGWLWLCGLEIWIPRSTRLLGKDHIKHHMDMSYLQPSERYQKARSWSKLPFWY